MDDSWAFDRQHGRHEQKLFFFGSSSWFELIVDIVERDDSMEDSRIGVLLCWIVTGLVRFKEFSFGINLGGAGRIIAGRSNRRTNGGREI